MSVRQTCVLGIVALWAFGSSCVASNGPVKPASADDIPWVDGFDLPVGAPNGQGYYIWRGITGDHRGEDWNGLGGGDTDLGDPVYAVADGFVTEAADIRMRYGKTIFIVHKYKDQGRTLYVESVYAHLQKILVKPGQKVQRGQKIGTIGTAGGLYEAHLHWEMRARPGLFVSPGYSERSNFIQPFHFIAMRRPEGAPGIMLAKRGDRGPGRQPRTFAMPTMAKRQQAPVPAVSAPEIAPKPVPVQVAVKAAEVKPVVIASVEPKPVKSVKSPEIAPKPAPVQVAVKAPEVKPVVVAAVEPKPVKSVDKPVAVKPPTLVASLSTPAKKESAVEQASRDLPQEVAARVMAAAPPMPRQSGEEYVVVETKPVAKPVETAPVQVAAAPTPKPRSGVVQVNVDALLEAESLDTGHLEERQKQIEQQARERVSKIVDRANTRAQQITAIMEKLEGAKPAPDAGRNATNSPGTM